MQKEKNLGLLILIFMVVALIGFGCSIPGKPGEPIKINVGNVIDLSDPKEVYKSGRLLGVGLGIEGNQTVKEISGMCAEVLDSDPQFFSEVLMEKIIIYLRNLYLPNDRKYILIAESGRALGFNDLDKTILTETYEGRVQWKAIRWFATGTRDGLKASQGESVPYPKDWNRFDDENKS